MLRLGSVLHILSMYVTIRPDPGAFYMTDEYQLWSEFNMQGV